MKGEEKLDASPRISTREKNTHLSPQKFQAPKFIYGVYFILHVTSVLKVGCRAKRFSLFVVRFAHGVSCTSLFTRRGINDLNPSIHAMWIMLGWLIDPKTPIVEVYPSDRDVQTLPSLATVSGEEVLPELLLDLKPVKRLD